MAKGKGLTQAEVWDDNELQAQWQAALDEYKKYHSIHAKGQDVATAIREAAEAERQFNEQNHAENEPSGEEGPEVVVDAEDENAAVPDYEQAPVGNGLAAEAVHTTGPPGLTIPQAMAFPSTHDEGLKNLMMSWYWAGYYTGLHEGQQQHSSKQTDKQA